MWCTCIVFSQSLCIVKDILWNVIMEMEDWVERDLGSYLFSGSVILSLLGVVLSFWFVLGFISWGWSLFGAVGLLGVFFLRAQKISVSAVRRVIKIERFGFFRGASFLIKFSEVDKVGVTELKNIIGYRSLYYLNFKLTNGSVIPLYIGFFPYFFKKEEVEKKLSRLEKLIFEG